LPFRHSSDNDLIHVLFSCSVFGANNKRVNFNNSVSQFGDENFSLLSLTVQLYNISNPDFSEEFDSCTFYYFFLLHFSTKTITRSHALAVSAAYERKRTCPVASSICFLCEEINTIRIRII